MDTLTCRRKAATLLGLHTSGRMLILPNIWSPVGARILESRGFPAVATASAALSASLGYQDGERIKRFTLIDAISRIARSVSVPVTADIESGYGETISEVEETIRQVLEGGIVGINVEDSLRQEGTMRPIAEQCERIKAVREVSAGLDVHLVINARIDTFVSGMLSDREARIEEAVVRARKYTEAGADCVYPIGPGDADTVSELRKRIDAPMNILASPQAAPLPVLQKLGVNRVSFGPHIFRSCLKKFVDIVDALHDLQSYDCFAAAALSRDEANAFLRGEKE